MKSIENSGQVITFYSFKGGTGRSMALANVASLLAQRPGDGRSALMVDWDLEAPGLACIATSGRV
jgi:MinD-like ATPase involved in chromosome partitioning or flagellar assembly